MKKSKRLRVWLGNLALVLISFGLVFGVLEWYFSTQVPRSGLTPSRTSTIPGLSHQLRPNFSTLYHGYQVEINSSGFRGPDFPPKGGDILRIALIGDSVTFGHVPWRETLGQLLESHLLKHGVRTEVLNLGVAAYDINHVAVLLEKQALDFLPDIVVYISYFNDVPPPYLAPQKIVNPDHVVDLFSTFPLRSAFLEWSGRRAKALMRAVGIASSKGYVATVQRNWREGGAARVRKAMLKIRDVANRNSICLVVANAPILVRQATNPFAEIERSFLNFSTELGMPAVNLRDAFEPDANLTVFHVGMFDDHPNGISNDRMAAHLAEELVRVPCFVQSRIAVSQTGQDGRLPF